MQISTPQQWRQVQHLANKFWHRQRKECLATLQSCNKWQNTQPNINDCNLVLPKDSNVNCTDWPMALVTKAHIDADGMVRKLELRVAKVGTVKTFFWPITEVIILMSSKD